jgi:WD40 repeat protein
MTSAELIALNPFPGLRPFDVGEAERFFAREQQIEEVVQRVVEIGFVAVSGSSGCGKSSLVRAGVLTQLSGRRGQGDPLRRRFAVMRPGNQPIANLAEQLAPVLAKDGVASEMQRDALHGRLRLGALGLVEAARLARLADSDRLLIVVDQFEELFRFQQMADPDEANAFVKLLLTATHDPATPISVIITLRSDALGSCADFRDLPEVVSRGLYLVPRMTRDRRRDAIVKPIELRQATIAPRLVQRILNDVSDSFDDLPVMQHVLARTWRRWAEDTAGTRAIDLEDYEDERVGTAKQALSRHADEAYQSLPGLESTVERVFEAITERTEGGIELRRPLQFDRLCEVVGGDPAKVRQVVERYRRPDTAFLMPPPEVPLTENPVIDISHESLIRQWQRLHVWAKEDAESTAMLRRVVDAARQNADSPDGLWRGSMLKRGLEWSRKAAPTTAWVGLRAGGDGREIWKSVEQFLAASSREAGRDRRRWTILIGTASALAGAVIVVGVIGAIDAYSRQRQTMSRELANRALLEAEREPARAARLALAAVDQDRDNVSADFALRQALVDLDLVHAARVVTLGRPVWDARYTHDGGQIVVAAGNTVSVFDTTALDRPRQSFTRDSDIVNAWLIAGGRLIVTRTRDRAQWQRMTEADPHPLSCPGEDAQLFSVVVSPDERWIGAGCQSGDVMVWDSAHPEQTPQRFGRADQSTVTALAFSFDGSLVASGTQSGSVEVWKVGTPGPWIGRRAGATISPIMHPAEQSVLSLAFHPTDNDLLVSTGDGGTAVVWQLDVANRRVVRNAKEPPPWMLPHERTVKLGRFAPRADSRTPLFTVSDKVVRFWIDQEADQSQVRAHDDWVNDATASSDGELLVSASSDGTARLWSTRSGAPIATLRGHSGSVTRASFSPDGQRVLTASSDGTVREWEIDPPRLLWHGKNWVLSAAFNPAGPGIAMSDEGEGAILDQKGFESKAPVARRNLSQGTKQDQIFGLSWSHDGDLLAGTRGTYTIYPTNKPVVLWDVQSGREITPDWMENDREAVFASRLDELLTLDENGSVVIWPFAVLADPVRPAPSLGPLGKDYILAAMSPDGQWIAAIEANDIALWQRSAIGAGPRRLHGHQGAVRSVEFSPDSRSFVSAGEDRTARIWSIDANQPARILSGGHSAALSFATFSPDGTLIATSSADRTIRVWNAASGRPLAVLRWHGDAVNQVRFSADGKWLLSASDDGTVKLGRCRPCTSTSADLRAMVPSLAVMTEAQGKDLEQEIAQSTARFSLSSLLTRRR